MKRTLAIFVSVLTVVLVVEAVGPVTFVDISASAGIRFVHSNGAFGKVWMPETFGSGAVFFDMDDDGNQDLLLVNSGKFPASEQAGGAALSALYRNRGGGRFEDVTKGSGLDVELYGMGAAAGDFDNDGLVDLYVTALRGGRLFRNTGNGKFLDVTQRSGVEDKRWSSSALWFDYDHDNDLDLVVGHYLDWNPAIDVVCNNTGRGKSICPPDMYKGEGVRLLRNRGNGTFLDATSDAKIRSVNYRTLELAILDYDADGWVDLFVANDKSPNQLLKNHGDGTFTDIGFRAGVAVSEAGFARAGMGVDAADYDGSGRPSIIVGNFSHEMMAMFHNEGNGLFIDEAPRSNIGKDTMLSLTFGLFFFDYDLDGRQDIFAANGHLTADLPAFEKQLTYEQRPHLFRNLGQKRFEETITGVGPDLARKVVARGAAHADIDNDGDLDLVVTENNGPARLYRNDGANTNHALRVKLVGTTSNRDAIGARVDVTRADGTTAWAIVKTGSSYLSQSELPLTFGLGQARSVKGVTVTWPGGRKETLPGVDADRTIVVKEGSGIVNNTGFRK